MEIRGSRAIIQQSECRLRLRSWLSLPVMVVRLDCSSEIGAVAVGEVGEKAQTKDAFYIHILSILRIEKYRFQFIY